MGTHFDNLLDPRRSDKLPAGTVTDLVDDGAVSLQDKLF